ncbi:MAG: hypothetical protein GX540_05300 [Clostridiales bacterium]|nr:hypothetical protein [Clostridiales bacterium]
MKALETAGRRMVFWGALLLIGWAVYELSIRFEEMVIWLSPVFSLAREGRITLWDYFSRVPWVRLTTHLFLFGCLLLGLYALLVRRRTILVLITVPLAILLGVLFLGSTSLMTANLWQKLKLIPLVLVAAGGFFCFISAAYSAGPKKGPKGQKAPLPTRHYDPFRIKGPPDQP